MIRLPPGCTVAYNIVIDVTELTGDMIEWFRLIEGTVGHTEMYNHCGVRILTPVVAYNAKPCYYMQDGTNNVRLHFRGADASTASLFLLKFNEYVVRHNMQDAMKRYERYVI